MRKRGLVHTGVKWASTGLFILTILFGQTWRESPVLYAESMDTPPVVDGWVEVSTPQQLIYIDMHQEAYLDQRIRLTNDIELPSGTGWIPIGGNGKAPFSGTFDGRGYRISGITNSGNSDLGMREVGFFGKVSGKIRNVGVEVYILSSNAQDRLSTGGLTGILDGGSIDHAYSKGRVEGGVGSSAAITGGLVGEAVNSAITASYSTVDVVSGPGANMYVGGLVGSQGSGTILNSFARGVVFGPADRQENSYINIGGFMGFLVYGKVNHSYASGRVKTGDVKYISSGGFAGSLFVESNISGSYFDADTTGMPDGVGAGGAVNAEVYGKSTSEMKQAATFQGWDFENTWAIHEGVNGGYPYLKPMILTEEIPAATQNESYRYKLEGYGYDSSAVGLNWQASGLPAGLTLSSDGWLEGVPNEAGTFAITVTATDSGMESDTKTFYLMVINTDQTAPTLASVSPVDGSAGVPVDTDLQLAFSEDIQPVAGKKLTLKHTQDGSVVESVYVEGNQVAVHGNTVTVDLYQGLAYETAYTVEIDPGSFIDGAGNAYAGITDQAAWTFTTAPPPAPPQKPGDQDGGDVPGTPPYEDPPHQVPPTQEPPPSSQIELLPYIRGYADGTFRPDQPVSRAELATLIWRLGSNEGKEPASGQMPPPYLDVDQGHWAYEAILFLRKMGIMQGFGDGSFRPEAFVTRGQFAAAMVRWIDRIGARGVSADPEKKGDFRDIGGHWAEDAIRTLAGFGVIQGYPDGTFQPEERITRAEAIKMINRLTGRSSAGFAGSLSFPDVPSSHWAYREILAATQKGTVTNP